jgi:NitT/TauT family transport system substrate-binding protein
MSSTRHAAKSLVLLVLVALAAVGCGGSGEPVLQEQAVAAPESPSESVAASEEEPTPTLSKSDLRVGVIGFGTDAAIVAASEQGFFEDEGLDVELELTRSGSTMIAALSGGSLDFGFGGISPPLHAISQGAPIRVIANLVLSHDLSLRINPEVADAAGIPVEGAALVDQVAALAGSGISIGVGGPGGGVHTQTVAMLQNYGVDVEEDVSIVHYETPDSLVAAFKQGEIDAYSWVAPHSLAVSDDEALKLVLGDLPEYEASVQWPVTTRTELMEAHPDSVEAFMRALVRGWLYMRDNPDEAGEAFRSRFIEGMDDAIWSQMWARVVANMGESPAVTPEGLDKALAITQAGAPAPLGLDFADVVDNTFVNRAIEDLDAGIPLGE